MSLTNYTNFITENNKTRTSMVTAADLMVSNVADGQFGICIVDSSKKNIWCMECTKMTKGEDISISGPCIHFVFTTNIGVDADGFCSLIENWQGRDWQSLIAANANMGSLSKCEVYGSFDYTVFPFTISNIFKNNTLSLGDDNTIKAFDNSNNIGQKIGKLASILYDKTNAKFLNNGAASSILCAT